MTTATTMAGRLKTLAPAVLTWVEAGATTAAYLALGRALDAAPAGTPTGPLMLAASFALVAGLATYAGSVLGFRATGPRERERRDAVLSQIFRLGVRAHSRERTGKVVSTTTDAVERAAFYETTFRVPILASMTVPIVALTGIGIAVSWPIAGWLALAIPLIPLLAGGFQAAVRGVSGRYRATARGLSAQFLDALQGLPTSTAFGQAEAKGAELAKGAEGLRRSVMRLLAGNQLILLVVDCAFSLGIITAATTLAAFGLRDGSITAGEAISVVLVSTVLLKPLDRIGQFFYIGMGGMASVREIRKLLDRSPEAAPQSEAPMTVADAGAAIALRGVTFAHDEGESVLTETNLEVAPGERVALVGPSGAGKTTILGLLQGTLYPSQGRVIVDGQDVASLDADELWSRISVVSQSTYLFTGSLADNLRLAAPEADDDELWRALDRAGLADEVRGFPRGLATPVGERGLSLSGGQIQRVAMARALLKETPVLLLDEPTSHVDGMNEQALMAALETLPPQTTVLMASHRPGSVRMMHRIVRLDGGRLTPAVEMEK